MSGLEDKTFNTIKVLGEKDASCDQGSIATHGGIYAKKNIMCDETVVTDCLVVKDMAKIAGDLIIGGRLCCPELYEFNDHAISYKHSLIPVRSGSAMLGTHHCPWKEIHADILHTDNIHSSSLCIGNNVCGTPTLLIHDGHVYVNGNFTVVDPETNKVMLKNNNGTVEAYTSIYQQWFSFQPIELCYHPDMILHITSSVIMLDIGDNQQLDLCYDANLVPVNTKIKVYFIHQKQSAWSKYHLVLMRNGKKTIFTSNHPSKKISLFCLEKNIYLIN